MNTGIAVETTVSRSRGQVAGADAPVDLAGYAASVHMWMNRTIFVDILQAVEEEAASCGLRFVRGAPAGELDEQLKVRLGEAAMRAQLRYVSPLMSREDIETSMSRWLADGDCASWANGILGALEAHGVGIVKN